jgi:hypothetical protein
MSVLGASMKANLKRKNYYLDENKIRRVRAILRAKTETEAIDAALNLVVFKEILKSVEKVAEKVVWRSFFSGKTPDRHRPVQRSYSKRNNAPPHTRDLR